MVDADPSTTLLRDVGRLIAMGLAPARRPTHDPEYAELIRRALDEPTFGQVLSAITAGLGLEVLDVSEYGVVFGAGPDSPFGLTVADYKKGLSSERRLVHGLVHVGLAAYLYPRAEDLESDAEVRRVSVRELDDYLREQCRALAGGGVDVPAAHPELERAFELYLRWPATQTTASGRRSTRTTQGIITAALEHLAEHGLLRRAGHEGGGTYQALRRYRVQVRELATQKALRVLRGEEGL